MKRLNFTCTLLTDIVISAQTATEGEHQSLDFIPGSNFLGMLASSTYSKNSEESYTLFHSGKIRFGDAHPLIGNSRTLQVPFCWYFPKGGELTTRENYMLSFMSKKNFDTLVKDGPVLEQARKGYFTNEGKYISIEKMFSQKTAYDPEKRRSAEGQMFGYEALVKGSQWQFSIDIDDDASGFAERIKTLAGTKKIGRSKTAEFGKVKIEISKEEDIQETEITPEKIELERRITENGKTAYENKEFNLVFLYAESRLAFKDQFGQPTFTPAVEQLGLPPTATILWDRSQIRTGAYAPWNGKRKVRDEDRVFIEKGSVFVVDMQSNNSFTTENIVHGVGLYRTEGFGKLLVNPGFLNYDPKNGKSTLQLEKALPDKASLSSGQGGTDGDEILKAWLNQQDNLYEVLKMVEDFIQGQAKKFKQVTNSQWENVRSYAFQAENSDDLISVLFEPPANGNKGGYLMHGVALEQWKDGKEILKKKLESMKKNGEQDNVILQFVEVLSATMQKKGGSK